MLDQFNCIYNTSRTSTIFARYRNHNYKNDDVIFNTTSFDFDIVMIPQVLATNTSSAEVSAILAYYYQGWSLTNKSEFA
jgi:hypothetical protein